MGAYEDLIRDTVVTLLEPGRPLTLQQIAAAVTPQLLLQAGWPGAPPILLIELVLKANPDRFAEVRPGTWVRRGDGPEAGVPSKPHVPLLRGDAAAAATPPEKLFSLDAVSHMGVHVAVEVEIARQRQGPRRRPAGL